MEISAQKITKFEDCLRKTYKVENMSSKEQWPAISIFANLQLLKVEKNEWCRGVSSQHVASDEKVKRIPILHGDLFKVEEGKKPLRKLLVEGSAGIGKTTLCTMLTEQWANGEILTQFDCVLFLPFRDQTVASASSLFDLLTLYHPDETVCGSVVQQLNRTKGKNVLIIGDGWDELREENRSKNSFIYNLFFGYLLPSASILLTSRPSDSAPLHKIPSVDCLIEVVGFSEEIVKQYIETYFKKWPKKAASLNKQLENNPLIQSVCSVPLNCVLICNLWCTSDRELPKTLTELYARIILGIVLHGTNKEHFQDSFDIIPADLQDTFWLICEYAFQCLLQNKTVFSEKELASIFPNYQCSDKMICFGLIQCVQSLIPNGKKLSFHFLHLTIQEFLAALHLTTLPSTEKKKLFEVHTKSSKFAIIWKFVFGLGCKEKDSKYSKKVISLDEYIVDRFVDTAESFSKLLLCHCSFESSNTIVSSKIAKKLNGQFETMHGKSIAHTTHDCVAVFSVLQYTATHDHLRISLNSCGLTDKILKKLTDILSQSSESLKVSHLSLADNQLTDEGLHDLFNRALVSLSSLELLHLAGNNTIDFRQPDFPGVETEYEYRQNLTKLFPTGSPPVRNSENLTDECSQTDQQRVGFVPKVSSDGIGNSIPYFNSCAQAEFPDQEWVRPRGAKDYCRRSVRSDIAQRHAAKVLSICALKLLPLCALFDDQADHSSDEIITICKLKLALKCSSEPNKAIQLPLTLQDDFAKAHKILLIGHPGTGKTTFIKHLMCQIRSRMLYFDMSWTRANELQQWPEDLLPVFGHQYAQFLIELECNSGTNSTVFLDNFTDRPLEANCILTKILEDNFLQHSKKVIACRSQYAEKIISMISFDHICTVKGFEFDELEHFFNSQNEHSETLILPFLKQNNMYHMCVNPLVSSCVLSVFEKLKYQLPKTLTDFMYKLTCDLLVHDFNKEEKSTLHSHEHIRLEKLSDSVNTVFNLVSQLAMEHLLLGHKCVNIEESWQFISSFLLQQSTNLSEVFRFSLVQLSTDMEPSRYVYQFVCPLMIEFLAAFHLYKQPPLNQLHFLFKHSLSLFKNGFTQWLRFFFGLVERNYIADQTQYNPTKLMMNTVIDVLVFSLELNYEAEYRYNLIMCINELQEKSLFRKLATKHPVVLSFSVQGKFDACVQPVLSLISKSGYKSWTAKTSKHNKECVDKLKSSEKSVLVVIDDSLGEMVSISPQRSHSEVAKMYRDIDVAGQNLTGEEKTSKFNQFSCRAIREILQRVFTIYSPVKIKGDATNVSYVSFLTCSCFEDSFNAHVRLYPLQPIHFLPGPKKDLSKVVSDHLTQTDNHNLSKHDGKSIEVVIMLRPFLQRIEGTIPMTNEKFSLVLSQDLIFDDFIISYEVEGDLVAFERCIDDYEANGAHTEQILPILPVVQKTIYGRSQTAYPRPFLPPVQEPRARHHILTASETTMNTLQDDSRGRSNSNSTNHSGLQTGSKVMVAVNDGQAPSFNPYLQRTHKPSPVQVLGTLPIRSSQEAFVHHFAEQAASETRVYPATSRRQTALTPGTILFTSMPDKIPSDQIQPLPKQDFLIRKGGNGSIFSENVGGLALAVKRTSYRSKEYAIITKIRHKNIIPLLAYVWGEEHQENRRRFFVYHYLPKLSGDLARLVTDKKELSLYEFHKVHQNNLRAMGVAVGNVKYILSQVLQGLQYLHQTHIAHRDLKSSNILIKFFCECLNPLECACDVKYQVVLCDFDAAIELDSNDCIPPTPLPASCTQSYMASTPSSHIEIVPVGTNGFRSPESSIHTIANTPEAFSPPLTTKTDIYSFGILFLRLMISTDTPHSQRTMAILLLYYNQLKNNTEGKVALTLSRFQKLNTHTTQLLSERRWLNFLQIQEDIILKVLKLNKLKSRISWLKGGYEFVRQCLSVDPETRPTSGDLLSHLFLN